MWLLRDKDGQITYLKTNKTINVGRKQADIILANDLSISREHATLSVTLKDEIKTSEVLSTCVVKDAKSKYGTYIIRNGIQTKVTTDGIELQPSDTVKFGLQQHTFTAEYIPFITVISRLSVEHKKQLKEIIDDIGGLILDCYTDNITHLTASSATLTNKVIFALIAGVPIININYWIAVKKAINENSFFPDPNLFTLKLQDKWLNAERVSLKPIPKRRTLFQGKKFIFFTEKTYREYKKIIKEAGGNIELHPFNSKNISKDLFADNNIIMQITDDNITDDLAVFNSMLYEEMLKKKLRMVAETEIPLAIAYVSLNHYCNPKCDFKELLKRKNPKEDTSKILALDTQDIMPNVNIGASTSKKVCIPETLDFMSSNTQNDNCEDNIEKIDIEENAELLTKKLSNVNTIKEKIKKTNECKSDENKTTEQDVEVESVKFEEEDDSLLEKQSFKLKTKNVRSESKATNETRNTTDEIKNLETSINKFKKSKKECDNIKDKKREREKLDDEEDNENVHSGWKSKETLMEQYVIKKKSITRPEDKDDFEELEQQKNVKGKKRQREELDVEEINENVRSEWKKKETSMEQQMKKSKSIIIPEDKDDFEELEQQKNKTKEKKEDKLQKWGFKKSEKKVINFDLDDLDACELSKPTVKETSKSMHKNQPKLSKPKQYKNTDYSDSSDKDDENSTKCFKKDDENSTKCFKKDDENSTKCLKKNTSSWTASESLAKDFSENKSIINVKSLKSEFHGTQGTGKIFQKVFIQIPQKRVALADMRVWRPNH